MKTNRKKVALTTALDAIEYVSTVGNVTVYNSILRNYKKGYKPAKDFVKNVAEKIDNGEIGTLVELFNYLTELELTEIIPYTYSCYKK